ncbi:hypothetical protein Pcar_2266 [Syntrophotalea carbinolica DSM 2380]|uniref:Lysozyme inhibitor LprI-like N-terminal domain-containing protein n=1 Tax=Syntrophotalea carbinolica (strain DSM 2380 / NBRC 103641 / GraBd1) TaxID=338963 RepID=Q3A2A2_SYNC1|nr:lysozyme inhibitor LprI family protein [Syntrophotalea carbinolica]ABA89505.1 hypothetical protein Pcar_2266 [Syntrophotalea carbinolica DSM 2380]
MSLGQRVLLLCIALSFSITCASMAEGPSFDCEKAGTKIEKMICADAELSKLDVRIDEAYAAALQATEAPETLKQQQRLWLKARNACDDAAGLSESYTSRLAQLAAEPADKSCQAVKDYCSETKNITSRLICSDQELSEMNRSLARSYARALERVNDSATFKRQHEEWLQRIYYCMGDRPCVWQRYRMYLSALDTFLKVADQTGQEPSGALAKKRSFEPPSVAASSSAETPAYTFRFEKDTDCTVCRDLQANYQELNPAQSSFACEIPLNPANPQFSWPQWQEMIVEDHLDVIYTIESHLLHDDLPPFEIWRSQYLADMAKGTSMRRAAGGKLVQACFNPRLRQTQVRFESDGRLEKVLGYTRDRFGGERCRESITGCPLPVNGNLEAYRAYYQCNEQLQKDSCVRMDSPGDHIVLFEPTIRQVHFVFPGDQGAGMSTIAAGHLFLHHKKAYLALVTVSGISVSQIERLEFDNPAIKPTNLGRQVCDIIFIFQDKTIK